MYAAQVLLLMLILPLFSVLLQSRFLAAGIPLWPLVGKWFVFWGVGVRLATAGARQAINPRYTAETILGLKTPEPQVVIRELGFANLALGIVALCWIRAVAWLQPCAAAG